ncbi:hypothetical protein L208DRAFT_1128618, partial [Tricholoma matsutake]
LRDDILLPQPAEEPEDNAPEILPPSVTRLLANSCDIQIEDLDVLWMELQHLIWDKEDFPRRDLAGTILKYGHGLGFVPDTLYPPQHSCIQPACPRVSKGLCLKKTYYQKVVLYTLDRGAVPAYAISLYCEECKTSYHHNYYIKQDFRYYYAQQPPIIKVGEHQFVDRKVIDLWIDVMVISHTSATNCSRLYHRSFSRHSLPPPDWPMGFMLTTEHIWDAFIIACLLDDCGRLNSQLIIPNNGPQKTRFNKAMQA